MVLQGPDKGRRFELPDAPALVGRETANSHCRTIRSAGDTPSSCPAMMDGFSAIWAAPTAPTSDGLRVTNRYLLKLGSNPRRATLMYSAPNLASPRPRRDVRPHGERRDGRPIMHTVPAMTIDGLAVPEPAAAAMSNLKSSTSSARPWSSFDIQQVLEVVMDLVFEHVKADRGIIFTMDEADNEVVPASFAYTQGRRRAEKSNDGHRRPIKMDGQPSSDEESKSCLTNDHHHVINNAEGVLSSNAMTDQRSAPAKAYMP